jgi:hypothetical protein
MRMIIALVLAASTSVALAKPAAAPGKAKFINAEASANAARNKMNFDAVDIGGETKRPAVDMIAVQKADQDYGFIKMRLNWNNEMIDTAAYLNRR